MLLFRVMDKFTPRLMEYALRLADCEPCYRRINRVDSKAGPGRWWAVVKRVTVVIPTFNRKEVLARAIRAHLCQSAVEEINEILVIDDGSSDGTEVRLDAL